MLIYRPLATINTMLDVHIFRLLTFVKKLTKLAPNGFGMFAYVYVVTFTIRQV